MKLINFGDYLVNADNITQIVKTKTGFTIYMADGKNIQANEPKGKIWEHFAAQAEHLPDVESVTLAKPEPEPEQ